MQDLTLYFYLRLKRRAPCEVLTKTVSISGRSLSMGSFRGLKMIYFRY